MTPKVQSNIVLVGFMGCGKTRVGELLAKTLGYNLIDTDALIEVDQGLSIKLIVTIKALFSFFLSIPHPKDGTQVPIIGQKAGESGPPDLKS